MRFRNSWGVKDGETGMRSERRWLQRQDEAEQWVEETDGGRKQSDEATTKSITRFLLWLGKLTGRVRLDEARRDRN